MTSPLVQHVTIASPKDITQAKVWGQIDSDYLSAAPAFRFRRSRDVPSRANDALLDSMDSADINLWHKRNAILAVRDFLEESWEPEDDRALPSTIQARANDFIYSYVATDVAGSARPKLMRAVSGTEGVTAQPVADNAVIASAWDRDAGSRYFFELESMNEATLTAAEFFGDVDDYENAWKTKVDIVRRVFPEGKEMHSTHEFLDLSVGAIVERFPFLDNQRKAVTKVRNALEKRLEPRQITVWCRLCSKKFRTSTMIWRRLNARSRGWSDLRPRAAMFWS